VRVVSINGCGLRLLGVGAAAEPGLRNVTVWATFLFLPLFPLQRWIIRPRRRRGFRLTFDRVARTPLDWREVRRTYLYGWLLFPGLLLLPMFAAAAIAGGVRTLARDVWPARNAVLHMAMVGLCGACIAALVVIIWRVASWNDRRYFGAPVDAPRR
jgi:hypothetical protein